MALPKILQSRPVKISLIVFISILVIIQLIPVDRTNPPVINEFSNWDSPKTKDYFKRACADCHSNETKWPWYSYIAPFKFIIASHVVEGRKRLNISDNTLKKAKDASEEVQMGGMPVAGYTSLHSDAKLSASEKNEFVKGLGLTFGGIQLEKGKTDTLANKPSSNNVGTSSKTQGTESKKSKKEGGKEKDDDD